MVAAAAMAVPSPKSKLVNNPVAGRDLTSSFFGGSLKNLSSQYKPRTLKRDIFSNLVVASTGNNTTAVTTTSGRDSSGRFYFNITGFPFPLGPFLNRSTIRTEVTLHYKLYTFHHSFMLFSFCV